MRKEANRLAAKKSADWVRLAVALPRTDDPDTVFHEGTKRTMESQ